MQVLPLATPDQDGPTSLQGSLSGPGEKATTRPTATHSSTFFATKVGALTR